MSHKHIKVFEQFSSEEMEYATREEEKSEFETKMVPFVAISVNPNVEASVID